ncbi:MAG: hypothetical protein SGJ19_08610 [Planctomycetia bacterium]|nr:hypothetical protein [Planctomycetia bacterium]
MSTTSATKSQSLENARREANAPRVQAVDVKEDLVEYMSCYAKQNPAHAALVCLGVGFILGWKLKPW